MQRFLFLSVIEAVRGEVLLKINPIKRSIFIFFILFITEFELNLSVEGGLKHRNINIK